MVETVVITGMGHGLGRAIALEFADTAETIVGCGRSVAPLQEVRDEIRADHEAHAEHVRCDVTVQADREYFLRKFDGYLGADATIDLLVPCAAVNHGQSGRTQLHTESYSHFEKHMETNAGGVFAFVKEVHDRLSEDARILVPTQAVARDGTRGYGSYAVSKAAVEAVARGFAADLVDTTVGCLEFELLATRLHTLDTDRIATGGLDPAEAAEMVSWAATELDSEDLDGQIVTMDEWREETDRLEEQEAQ